MFRRMIGPEAVRGIHSRRVWRLEGVNAGNGLFRARGHAGRRRCEGIRFAQNVSGLSSTGAEKRMSADGL